jgi:hypothetical protein
MVPRMNRSHPKNSIASLALTMAALAAATGSGCGSDGKAATATTSDSKGRISSSIVEGAQLSTPVRWEARVSEVRARDVVSMRFLIDGRSKHLERRPPFEFAGRRNLLIPGTLGPGSHTFAVDARLRDGRRLTAASTATVSETAGGVPSSVVGSWARTIRRADVRRTKSFRIGNALPVGTWNLRIGSDAIARYTDPLKRKDSLTVGQVRFEPDGLLVVGNEIPNIPRAEGYFCPDTVGVGKYHWSLEGGALVVKVASDRCADRNSFWNGKFTRQERSER